MPTRATILESFCLNDRPDFEIEPHTYADDRIPRVMFRHEGDPSNGLKLEDATRLASKIRDLDPGLAERVDACVEKARRWSKDLD